MTGRNESLAVIIPVFNEGGSIRKNLDEIRGVFARDGIPCRFMLVDDGSTDHTWSELQALAGEFEEVSAVRFARNFGKEAAIFAGINSIDADRYLIMDSDLQHPPECAKDMLALMEKEQADIIDGVKESRGRESVKYRFYAKCFYRLLRLVTGLDLCGSSDFKLLNRRVAEHLLEMKESRLFFRGLVDWVGFKRVSFSFAVGERTHGFTRFSTRKLVKLAFDAFFSFTDRPLHLALFFGVFFLLAAAGLGLWMLISSLSGRYTADFSVVILLLLVIGAVILISLGTVGVYISRIYDEVKGRPRYIVSERIEK